jgi:hypothetical protein
MSNAEMPQEIIRSLRYSHINLFVLLRRRFLNNFKVDLPYFGWKNLQIIKLKILKRKKRHKNRSKYVDDKN